MSVNSSIRALLWRKLESCTAIGYRLTTAPYRCNNSVPAVMVCKCFQISNVISSFHYLIFYLLMLFIYLFFSPATVMTPIFTRPGGRTAGDPEKLKKVGTTEQNITFIVHFRRIVSCAVHPRVCHWDCVFDTVSVAWSERTALLAAGGFAAVWS